MWGEYLKSPRSSHITNLGQLKQQKNRYPKENNSLSVNVRLRKKFATGLTTHQMSTSDLHALESILCLQGSPVFEYIMSSPYTLNIRTSKFQTRNHINVDL